MNPDPWCHVRAKLRQLLFAGLGIAMLAGLVGMASVYAPALWPERQEPASVRPPVSPTLARAGDAAGNAVMQYRAAAHLWNNRRMACAELGRHLVSVDEAWITYSIERGAMSEVLDAAGVERERTLESDVTSVEQHFHTTGCPRP